VNDFNSAGSYLGDSYSTSSGGGRFGGGDAADGASQCLGLVNSAARCYSLLPTIMCAGPILLQASFVVRDAMVMYLRL
jgi:hypothetical protein